MTRRLFIAATASLFAASSAAAQADSLPHRGYPAHASAATDLVTSRYDEEQDRTILETRRLTLDASLSLTALVALEGRTVRKEAPGVTLTVWSTAPRGRLAGNPAVALELDGRRIELRKLWIPPTAREPYTEVGLTGVDLNRWLALASARRVVLYVGDASYPLPDESLAGIREFAALMRPSTSP